MAEQEPLVKIKTSSLTVGTHKFLFQCSAADFHDAEITTARFPNPITVRVLLTKTASELLAEFSVETTAVFECDRCLKPLQKDIVGKFRVLFTPKAVHHHGKADAALVEDETRTIGRNDTEIDLTNDVRDTVVLAVPIKNVCDPECEASVAQKEFLHRVVPEESEWQRKLRELNQKFQSN